MSPVIQTFTVLQFFLSPGDGEVWMAGWNAQGQLGVGHTQDLPLPKQVLDLPKVTSVSCGWNHTLAITGNGIVMK